MGLGLYCHEANTGIANCDIVTFYQMTQQAANLGFFPLARIAICLNNLLI